MSGSEGKAGKIVLPLLPISFIIKHFYINTLSLPPQFVGNTWGITGTALQWFVSYLSNRLQFVHVNVTLYMLPLGSIIRRHSIHFHFKLQECLKDIKTWMAANFLLLNSDQTDVIVLGPEKLRNMVSNQILTLDGITLASSNTVRNLGVIFKPGYVLQYTY
uniref:Uncharacterized protein n=1 Tax=Astatotilapia calliptera TaxID=8154 RepID=A0A3P8N944_ASTCA